MSGALLAAEDMGRVDGREGAKPARMNGWDAELAKAYQRGYETGRGEQPSDVRKFCVLCISGQHDHP